MSHNYSSSVDRAVCRGDLSTEAGCTKTVFLFEQKKVQLVVYGVLPLGNGKNPYGKTLLARDIKNKEAYLSHFLAVKRDWNKRRANQKQSHS